MSPVPLWTSDAFRRWIGYSTAAHALAVIVVAVGPGVSATTPAQPIFVDLVAAAPQPVAKRRPPKRRQVVDEAVVIPKQAEPSRSKPKPASKPASPPVQADEAPSADEILAQLRAKVASRTPGAAAGAAQGREGRPEDPELAAYKARVMSCLYEHWAGARAFSRSPELEVQFQVKITDRGGVRSVSLTRSSSNRYLDDSAERAIWKCEPFEAPPRGVSQFNLTFNPADLV